MNKLDRLFLRVARMDSLTMRRTARDGTPSERHMARLCLLLDAHIEDAKKGNWVTSNGTHILVGKGGKIIKGPERLRKESEKRHGSKSSKGSESSKETSAPSATGANKLARGFTPSRAKEHEKHRREQYPNLSPKQYEQRGIELCEQKVGGDIDGFLNNSGNIVRYRKSTNELAVGHPQRGLMTLFKPGNTAESGRAYFERKKSSAEKSARKGKTR